MFVANVVMWTDRQNEVGNFVSHQEGGKRVKGFGREREREREHCRQQKISNDNNNRKKLLLYKVRNGRESDNISSLEYKIVFRLRTRKQEKFDNKFENDKTEQKK